MIGGMHLLSVGNCPKKIGNVGVTILFGNFTKGQIFHMRHGFTGKGFI